MFDAMKFKNGYTYFVDEKRFFGVLSVVYVRVVLCFLPPEVFDKKSRDLDNKLLLSTQYEYNTLEILPEKQAKVINKRRRRRRRRSSRRKRKAKQNCENNSQT